ncbi:phosphatase IMPL1, chloroplastic isoform X3 [Manihot esculenta]|uniref:phosphatase IMPL1, chloroplastic isoform X3 n=1 Tax=Manihot esculenta TaxID=3983 RepID=UPI001CC3F9C7|nr:phosphatase IMPL1, chloroplastic isoform X3 [Manihot esculenta]
MGKSLVFSTTIPLRFSHLPRSISPFHHLSQCVPQRFSENSQCCVENGGIRLKVTPIRRNLSTKAVLSEPPNQRQYPKVAAKSTGPIPPSQLIQVVETAAKTGAEVVMDAVNKPRNISYKGLTDLVTDTDKMSEAAILEVVRKNFADHLILGEEGGVIGDSFSEYLWCIDPLDGTTNFAHGYPSFAVSVGVLFRGNPAAAAVVEFVGGSMAWNTRIFSATAGGGAFCNGHKIHASQTDKMVEEAGGTVTRMDGGKFCVFDRSVLVSNGVMHAKLLERIAPTTEKLKAKGIDFSLWYKPENYPTDF